MILGFFFLHLPSFILFPFFCLPIVSFKSSTLFSLLGAFAPSKSSLFSLCILAF